MELYGIGITKNVTNNFTIFFGNTQFVFAIVKFKIKIYNYKSTEHKPVLKSFLGLTIGDLYPNQDEQNKY